MRKLLLLLFLPATVASQSVNRIEYFIDVDPGPGNGTAIAFTASPDVTQAFSLPLNTVSAGFHIMYFRARSAGRWSLPLARPVVVQIGAQTASAMPINRIEYFFDADPGYGNGTNLPITAATNVIQNLSLPLSSIANGFHHLCFRARTANGLWTQPFCKPVIVQPNAQTAAAPSLQRLEYFMDNDPGVGNGVSVPLSLSNESQALVIDLSGITPGFHILHIRALDANGRWSMTQVKPFVAEYSGDDIVALEYSFTDGTTTFPTRTFTGFAPGTDLTVNFAAALTGLAPGTLYTMHIVGLNTRGQSSTAVTHAFTTPAVICDPLSAPVTTGASVCGSGTAALTASGAASGQSYLWYPDATGPTPIPGANNSTFNTPVLTSSTTYYAVILNGTCESARTPAVATIQNCNSAPTLAAATFATAAGSSFVIPVLSLVTDPDNNIDPASLQVIVPPLSGAGVQINNGVLTLTYTNVSFAGQDQLTVQVCDLAGACVQQVLLIDVIGDIKIFNAVSPNGDGKNDYLFVQYIDAFPETQQNKLTIYNRWGTVVFEAINYDNTTNVFRGIGKSGEELPIGTYYYVLEFTGGSDKRTGFIALRK